MAKLSSIEKNIRRQKMVKTYLQRRQKLNEIIHDRTRPDKERYQATGKLGELPRNSSQTRVRNRCSITGRSRGYYRKFKMSRIALRDFASLGMIPGMTKASW